MDKIIVAAGAVIAALGTGFAIAGEFNYTLHSAYGMGGAFWAVLGAITLGFGLRVNRTKKPQQPVRIGAV